MEASSLCHAIANVCRIRLHGMHERGALARMIFLAERPAHAFTVRGYQIDYQPEHSVLLAGDAGPDQSLHPLSAMIRPFQSDQMPFDQLPEKLADIIGNQGFFARMILG